MIILILINQLKYLARLSTVCTGCKNLCNIPIKEIQYHAILRQSDVSTYFCIKCLRYFMSETNVMEILLWVFGNRCILVSNFSDLFVFTQVCIYLYIVDCLIFLY